MRARLLIPQVEVHKDRYSRRVYPWVRLISRSDSLRVLTQVLCISQQIGYTSGHSTTINVTEIVIQLDKDIISNPYGRRSCSIVALLVWIWLWIISPTLIIFVVSIISTV